MMDCKRALEEADGDLLKAAELLRAKGIAQAEKRAGRSTSQGVIAGAVTPDGGAGALVELTCETDFVARTAEFQRTAEALVAQALADAPPSVEAFLERPAAEDAGRTVGEVVKALTAKTGEAVALRHVVTFAPGARGAVGLYLHHNRQVGVLVELAVESESAARHHAVQDLARELALHVASADPLAVRGEDIPEEVLERERRIAAAEAESKPEAVRTKIVEGKIRKFRAERALLEQPWVKDDQKPVAALVAEAAQAAGTEITVVRFQRLRVGET
jgi:elongation factor Ts